MKTLNRAVPALASLLLLWTPAAAQQWTSARPDGHAPIGVMADHTHEKNEMMLSYRYMRMSMDGLRTGTDALTAGDVLATYPVTPVKMPMQMHMFGVMYAPADRVTLMAMVPFVKKDMDHVTGMGGKFTTSSSGLGDISAQAMIVLFNRNRQRVHLTAGVSLPTGSIDEMDQTPASMGNDVQLPYPMQSGSGTFDLLPGLTYLGQTDSYSWGAQGSGVIRLGDNDRDYHLGNALAGTVWGARRWSQWVSTSLRLAGRTWGEIKGADAALNPMMVPTADPANQGGNRIDALAGINFEVARGGLKGQRLAIEFGVPVYRSVNGIQLESDWVLTAGWQYAFALKR
ncbi:MAG: transporter [Gemmatimonadales bacterium]